MYTVVDKICSFIFENKLSEKFKNLYWIMHCPPVLTFCKNIFVTSRSIVFIQKVMHRHVDHQRECLIYNKFQQIKTPLKVGAVICSTTKHKHCLSMRSLRFTHTNTNFSTFKVSIQKTKTGRVRRNKILVHKQHKCNISETRKLCRQEDTCSRCKR